MTHWRELNPDKGVCTNVCFQVNYRLFQFIEQTRGEKSRSQYLREILTKVMKNA